MHTESLVSLPSGTNENEPEKNAAVVAAAAGVSKLLL